MKPLLRTAAPTLLLLGWMLGLPAARCADATAGSSSPATGWSSSWTDAITPQEKSAQQFRERFAAAAKTRNFGPLLADCLRDTRAHPDDFNYKFRLLAIHWKMQHWNDCLADLDRIDAIYVRTHQGDQALATLHFDRSLIYSQSQNYAGQAAELEMAVKLNPAFPPGLNNLAWLRATNPDAGLRNGREAVERARQALQLLPTAFSIMDTLAAAYAETGDYPHALSCQRKALELARQDAVNPPSAAAYLKAAPNRLALYTRGQPFREAAHVSED